MSDIQLVEGNQMQCRHKGLQSKQEHGIQPKPNVPPPVVAIIEWCPECGGQWRYEPCTGDCGNFVMRKEDRFTAPPEEAH